MLHKFIPGYVKNKNKKNNARADPLIINMAWMLLSKMVFTDFRKQSASTKGVTLQI